MAKTWNSIQRQQQCSISYVHTLVSYQGTNRATFKTKRAQKEEWKTNGTERIQQKLYSRFVFTFWFIESVKNKHRNQQMPKVFSLFVATFSFFITIIIIIIAQTCFTTVNFFAVWSAHLIHDYKTTNGR